MNYSINKRGHGTIPLARDKDNALCLGIKNRNIPNNQHFIYDYVNISKFTKENKVSVQAMLTAMITRATRKYLKLDNDQIIVGFLQLFHVLKVNQIF